MNDLTDTYANAAHIAGGDDYLPRWMADAAAFRDRLGDRASLNLSYGPSKRMAYDLFHPERTPRGTMIFVHGGYWCESERSHWSHFATGALAQGWAVAMPSYDLCPDITIAGITQQIAQAIMRIADRSPGPLSLAGHSAGGHLVARMLAPGMLHALLRKRLAHVVAISPISDLEPLIQTDMNRNFRLDIAMARTESPRYQPVPDRPVTVWVGADERPVFLDQARWLAEAWGCDQVVTNGEHHFNVIDSLANPNSDLVRRLTPDA